jgi:serine O-acetyltransferase
MLAKLIIDRLGGFWALKAKIKNSSGLKRKLLTFLYRTYLYENSADISINAEFADTPCMPHGERGVFISGGAKVGKNAIIFQQVTIGSVTLPDSKGVGAPTIGDNCYIGAGAKIVGKIKIGDNVRIGANAVVYKDVPDNSVVVSGEQKTITKSEPLVNRYYTYDDGEWRYFKDGRWISERDEKVLEVLKRI